MEFANEPKTLIFEFHTELQDMIITMKQNFAERENGPKNQFHSICDEVKNLEEEHALRVQLETAVVDLWAQFHSMCDEVKNLEEEHALRVQLETAVVDLWAQFHSMCDDVKNLEEEYALKVQLETAVGELWAQFQSAVRNRGEEQVIRRAEFKRREEC